MIPYKVNYENRDIDNANPPIGFQNPIFMDRTPNDLREQMLHAAILPLDHDFPAYSPEKKQNPGVLKLQKQLQEL